LLLMAALIAMPANPITAPPRPRRLLSRCTTTVVDAGWV
jgi:hypothetical protein